MKRIILMGPPGVGKGTQSVELSAHLAVAAVSTGDMFRAHVRERTPLGLTVSELIAAGEYIPDEVTNSMVEQRLAEPEAADGFILDGYPRTPDQISQLDEMLAARSRKIDAAILLTADDAEIVSRLTARATSQGRNDDTPELIRHRIEVYKRETAPLAQVYLHRGVLVTVDGVGDPKHVAERIAMAISSR